MVSNYLRERLGTVLVAPPGYTTPPFPSLYWPLPPSNARYLYYNTDIWRFTLFWTLLIFTAFHLAAGLYAFLMMLLAASGSGSSSASKNDMKSKNDSVKGKVKIKPAKRKGRGQRYAAALVVPFIFIFIGALEAVLSGSVVGFILAAVYNAGYFRLSTLIPPIWGLINVLVIILSSYSVHGAL